MLRAYDEKAPFFLTIENAIRSNTGLSARKEKMIADLADDVREILTTPAGATSLSRIAAEALAGTVFALVRATIGGWVEAKATIPILDLFDEAASVVQLEAKICR